MKPSDVKDAIVEYLECIVNRINYINHQHPDNNMSLDIDLVKDDIRALYSKLELLKSMALPRHSLIIQKSQKTGDDSKTQPGVKPLAEESGKVDTGYPSDQGQETLKTPHTTEKTTDAIKEQRSGKTESAEAAAAENEKQQMEMLSETQKTTPEPSDVYENENLSDSHVISETTETIEKSETFAESNDSELPHVRDEKTMSGSQDIPENHDVKDTNEERSEPISNYHQSGIDFSDSTVASKETDDSEKQDGFSESNESETERIEDKPEATKQSNKTVIDLLSDKGRKTIGDQYVEADNSLNKRISADNEDKSISARMQQKPISNIKEVIGVNEKFLFINELFEGNFQEYHDAIARLNDMQGMQEAFDYLNILSEKYSWDANRSAATIEKLANYVQRRYL